MPVTPLSAIPLSATPSKPSAFGAYPATPQGSSPSDYESCPSSCEDTESKPAPSNHELFPGHCEDTESKPTPSNNCVTPKQVPLVLVDETSTTDTTKSNTFQSIASHKEDTSPDTSRRVTTQDKMTLILNILKLAAGRRQLTPSASTNLSHLLKKSSSDPAYAALRPHHQPQTLFHNNAQPKKSSHASKPDTKSPANDQKPTAK